MSERGKSIRQNISAEYEKTPGYLIWDITEAVGQELDLQDAAIARVRNMFDVDFLSGADLEKTVRQYKGIIRRAATYAVGAVTVSGTGTVPKGSVFETPNGIQFIATQDTVVNDSGIIPVTAAVAGNSGVVGARSITQMPITIAGISSCINNTATEGGYDAESDEDLRKRYYAKLQRPDNGVNKYAYQNMALEVPGVGDAQIFPLERGENTVEIVIIDTQKLPASPTLVEQTQKHIDPGSTGKGEGTAQMGAHCFVVAATEIKINITATIKGSKDIETNLKESIKKYLASTAFNNNDVSYAKINSAILDTQGVIDVENLKINGGISNIKIPKKNVATLGTVVFSYA